MFTRQKDVKRREGEELVGRRERRKDERGGEGREGATAVFRRHL